MFANNVTHLKYNINLHVGLCIIWPCGARENPGSAIGQNVGIVRKNKKWA